MRHHKRVVRAAAICALAVTGVGSAAFAATTASWTSAASGLWTDPTRWSTNPNYPSNGTPAGETYDVQIGATGSAYAVTYSGAINTTVNSVALNSANATLRLASGTLNVTDTLNVNAGTLRLGFSTFSGAIGGSGSVIVENATLSGVSLNADLATTASQQWYIANGLTVASGHFVNFVVGSDLQVSGAQTIGGGGELRFSGDGIDIQGELTIGSGITAKTIGSTSTVVLGVAGGNNTITNNGTLWLNSASGYMSLLSQFVNNGTIRVDAGALNLGGTDSLGNWGTLVRNGGTVNFVGTLHNTAKILDLARTPVGPVNIGTGAIIDGGTIANSGAGAASFVRSEAFNPIAVSLIGVTLACPMNVQSSQLQVSGSLTLSGNPNVRLVGSNLSTIGIVVLGSGSIGGSGVISFETSGTAEATVQSLGGALTLGPGVTVRGVSSFGTVRGFSGITNQGTISAQAPGKFLTTDGNLSNQGTVEARNGGMIFVSGLSTSTFSSNTLNSGKWAAYAGSSIDLNGKSVSTNNAAVLLDGAGSTFTAINPLASNGGTFEIDHGRNFTTVGALSNSGTLRVGKDSTLTVNGTFTNTGTIKGKGRIIANVNSSGLIAPGESPGVLSITGNLAMTSSGVLEIEVGGTTPGVDYDVLDVSAALTLDGTLQVSFINGFQPDADDVFDFFNFGSVSGQFDTVNLPPLAPGVTWDTSSLQSGGPTNVPEPSGLVALGAASVIWGTQRRQRRSKLPRSIG